MQILIILALICFLVAAVGLPTGRLNLTALGLALLAASQIFGGRQ